MVCVAHNKRITTHDQLVDCLPLVHRAARKAFRLLGRAAPCRDDSDYLEVFGRGQEVVVEEFEKGQLTPYLINTFLPLRLREYMTAVDQTIPVPASTNRDRVERGEERLDFNCENYETHKNAKHAKALYAPYYKKSDDPNPIAAWLLGEKELKSVNTTYLTIYIFCTDDDTDRKIVNLCWRDFDPNFYEVKHKVPQRQIASEAGISPSQVQRRLAEIKQRFNAIRRKR